ncbi:prolyl oligopeptidase family serine peptidase [Sphingomonas jejuensis]|nr:prolyl oligopeptidase family serine peptidase [Sphingomonas jejuensis]
MLASTAAAWAQPAPFYPPAPAEPFSEEVFGHRVDDPYRWMEDPARAADMRAWLATASDATVRRLRALPERERFATLLRDATQAGVGYSRVQSAGGRLFYMRRDPGARVPKLVVRDGTGPERVLLDPGAGTAATRTVDSFAPSPDGRAVALLVSEGGAELGRFQFMDVETGQVTGQLSGRTFGDFELTWLGSDLVTYTQATAPETPGADPLLNTQATLVRLGGAAPVERILLGTQATGGPTFQPQEFPAILGDADSPVVFGFAFGARADARMWFTTRDKLLAGRPDWVPVADYADQLQDADVAGDQLYYISTRDASNGALYRRSLAGRRLGPAQMVLPGGDLALSSLVATADGLYLVGTRDGVSHLLFMPPGEQPREVALPFESELDGLKRDTDGRSVVFGLRGWTNAQASFRATGGQLQSLGLDSAMWAPARAFRTRREEAISRDGTRVPLVILSRPDPAGPVPTILEGYGSYGVLTTSPFYSPFFAPWVERGGAFAFCGTRGGGERGRAWHEAGRAANKHNAHDDLAACAERIQTLGIATPATTIVTGTSAGGLLAPSTAIEHPELFAGLVPRVAVLNATRLGAAPNGPNQFGEMGDPRTRDGYEGLMTQDAYLQLADAARMPPTLVTVGLNDTRVVPWMGAKFAARAASRFGADQVLVRADADQGHGIGSATDTQVAEFADVYAWAWDRATPR